MEAKELRIGNYVSVFGVKVGIIKNLSIHKIIIDCTPIHLTEQWLLDLGFKRKGFDMKKNGFKLTASTRIIESDRLGAFHYKKVGYIDSVHKLQNLYFALTEKELELKNKL